jgi:hypothetical protein
MKHRFLIVAAMTALALGTPGGPVATAMSGGGVGLAAPYTGSSATVSDSTPAPGQTVTVSGGGFTPNSTVTIVLDPGAAGLGSTTASATGVVSAAVTIPVSASGARTIVLSGTATNGKALTLSVAVNVGAVGSDIPTTGSDSLPILLIAIGAMGAGAALWGGVSVRRRRPPVAG